MAYGLFIHRMNGGTVYNSKFVPFLCDCHRKVRTNLSNRSIHMTGKEVAIAIQRLKCNKASGYDGLPAELFEAGGDELVSCIHDLLCNIWSLESMSSDWCLSLL